jgi:TRAP-type C4-dicarboxylate transport system permease large subunit
VLCGDGILFGGHIWAAIIILSREVLVSGLREYLGQLRVSVPVTKIAKYKTTLQLVALGFLIAVNLLIFLLAFFLDFFEIAFIIVPLLAPVAAKLGIDLVWFGVLLGINMQTSFMHPPFGFALFYLRSVAPRSVRTADIYWGAIPFVAIQVLMVALVLSYPGLVGVRDAGQATGTTIIQMEDAGAAYLLPPEDKP